MRALVIGGGGFIGHNLVKRLKAEGWAVNALDLKLPDFEASPALFTIGDASLVSIGTNYDRIYQLAADMGGAGFVFTGDNDADILNNSLAINLNLTKQLKDFKGTVFYSSSACAYPNGVEGKESDAYPANPPHDYGWEKLISERVFQAYHRNYGLDIRIARFQNTYGPYGTFQGGREKAPAAICRKVCEAESEIEIWGDGKQIRPFVYIDDLLDGIEILMASDVRDPVNIGPSEGISIDQMVDIVQGIAGKDLKKKHIDGPTGEQIRRCDNTLIKSLGWNPQVSLEEGLKRTYDWICGEIRAR